MPLLPAEVHRVVNSTREHRRLKSVRVERTQNTKNILVQISLKVRDVPGLNLMTRPSLHQSSR